MMMGVNAKSIFFMLLYVGPNALLVVGLGVQASSGRSKPINCQLARLESFDPLPMPISDGRRAFFGKVTAATGGLVTIFVAPCPRQQAWARTPGSNDLAEAVQQIRDASEDLRKLQRNWEKYAVIDKEGRSVGDATVLARRILGGVAPLAGTTAIEVAKATPLYRIDGAFNVVRKATIAGWDAEVNTWVGNLDLPEFEEIAERIQFQLQKADGDFYSVQFASKGTTQISGIFKEAKAQVDQGIGDFETIIQLLKDAGAPGL